MLKGLNLNLLLRNIYIINSRLLLLLNKFLLFWLFFMYYLFLNCLIFYSFYHFFLRNIFNVCVLVNYWMVLYLVLNLVIICYLSFFRNIFYLLYSFIFYYWSLVWDFFYPWFTLYYLVLAFRGYLILTEEGFWRNYCLVVFLILRYSRFFLGRLALKWLELGLLVLRSYWLGSSLGLGLLKRVFWSILILFEFFSWLLVHFFIYFFFFFSTYLSFF